MPALVWLALALDLVYACGFLFPLALWRHHSVVTTPMPLATVLGTGVLGAMRFVIPCLLAFALMLAAVRASRHATRRLTWGVVLGATALFSLTLLPTNPLAAKDIFHNIADARTFWLYHQNPLAVPPAAHKSDPIYHAVSAWQTFPSTYGPLWYILAGAPLHWAGSHLWANVIGQKVLSALFLLGSTALAMAIAERLDHGAAAVTGVLVGWNPLLQFETAVNAHNDIVMVCFALAALLAAVHRRWLLVFPLLALAVATKYVLVLLAPFLLIWMLRDRRAPRLQIAGSIVLGGLLFGALSAPFFEGLATLRHIRQQAGYLTSSPATLIQFILMRRPHLSTAHAAAVAKLLVAPEYVLTYVVLLWRTAAAQRFERLIQLGAWALLLLLLGVTWWFWPWYVMLVVPFAALLPGTRVARAAIIFSLTALLMYVPYFWLIHTNPLLHESAIVLVTFVPPAAVAVLPRLARYDPAGWVAGAVCGRD